jgi:REP element-mobilizing transposase RayT
MANTYSQINIHCIFAVQGRENIITSNFRSDLFKYMSGILSHDNAFPLAVGGWKDHVHVFFELPVTSSVSDLMRMLKATSSKWINDNSLVKGKFRWQEGYAAFSNSKSQRNRVIQYIINQEIHHKNKTFKEEYLVLLDKHNINFDEKYLFEFYEEDFI